MAESRSQGIQAPRQAIDSLNVVGVRPRMPAQVQPFDMAGAVAKMLGGVAGIANQYAGMKEEEKKQLETAQFHAASLLFDNTDFSAIPHTTGNKPSDDIQAFFGDAMSQWTPDVQQKFTEQATGRYAQHLFSKARQAGSDSFHQQFPGAASDLKNNYADPKALERLQTLREEWHRFGGGDDEVIATVKEAAQALAVSGNAAGVEALKPAFDSLDKPGDYETLLNQAHTRYGQIVSDKLQSAVIHRDDKALAALKPEMAALSRTGDYDQAIEQITQGREQDETRRLAGEKAQKELDIKQAGESVAQIHVGFEKAKDQSPAAKMSLYKQTNEQILGMNIPYAAKSDLLKKNESWVNDRGTLDFNQIKLISDRISGQQQSGLTDDTLQSDIVSLWQMGGLGNGTAAIQQRNLLLTSAKSVANKNVFAQVKPIMSSFRTEAEENAITPLAAERRIFLYESGIRQIMMKKDITPDEAQKQAVALYPSIMALEDSRVEWNLEVEAGRREKPASQPANISTREEWDALPSGAPFIWKDGKRGVK